MIHRQNIPYNYYVRASIKPPYACHTVQAFDTKVLRYKDERGKAKKILMLIERSLVPASLFTGTFMQHLLFSVIEMMGVSNNTAGQSCFKDTTQFSIPPRRQMATQQCKMCRI